MTQKLSLSEQGKQLAGQLCDMSRHELTEFLEGLRAGASQPPARDTEVGRQIRNMVINIQDQAMSQAGILARTGIGGKRSSDQS